MNLRQIIKLNGCEFIRMEKLAYDNPYLHRLSLNYGPKDSPYHDALMMSYGEIKDFLRGLDIIRSQVKSYLKSIE